MTKGRERVQKVDPAKPRCAVLAAMAVLACLLWGASSASAAQQVITSSGPLKQIYLNDDLACQVFHTNDTVQGEFFGGTAPGSCGTFVAVPGESTTLYGPDVTNGPPVSSYSLVGQSPVTGSGSSGDPYVVTTTVQAGPVELQQTDSYVVGEDSYTTRISLSRLVYGSSELVVTVYHAGDCTLQGSDSGYGSFDSGTGGIFCSANPNDSPAGASLGFIPSTASSSYRESLSGSVWGEISAGDPFSNACDCTTLQDNGAGLSWDVVLPADDDSESLAARAAAVTSPISFRTRVFVPPASSSPPSNETPGSLPPGSPHPILGKTAVITHVTGHVFFKPPGSSQFIELLPGQSIPFGSTINANHGHVTLMTARHDGGTQSAEFFDGTFVLTQETLTDATQGTRARALAHSARKKRRLWGKGKGRFRTKGTYGSASVRGTQWLTEDETGGTRFTVTEGVISVSNFVLKKTVIVRAPNSYFAAVRKAKKKKSKSRRGPGGGPPGRPGSTTVG
jgi:hypothetical protein